MRIAVIGGGISGLAVVRLLSRRHAVCLFEGNSYLGGHTHTHQVEQAGHLYHIDTGFIVYNPVHYPLLSALFEELSLATQPTTMSFSVHHVPNGLEYSSTSLRTLFCQRHNLISPRFMAMMRDLLRFYREAPALLHLSGGPGPSLEDYLATQGYCTAFRDDHLIPMACALWSSPPRQILSFPARYLVQFMANHRMLQIFGRPQWRVVQGGSWNYVRAMRMRWGVEERLSLPVLAVRRHSHGVDVTSSAGTERFHQVVMACHSDEALTLLTDATDRERDILGAIRYQANDTVLHTDATLLPRNRSAWAAWNARIPSDRGDACTVSYWMSLLQNVVSPEPFIVTLNCTHRIDPARILRRMTYRHPVYEAASVAAQKRKHEIQGQQRTWFCGAYWGWGFHEDGMRSAVDVAQALEHGVKVDVRPAKEVA